MYPDSPFAVPVGSFRTPVPLPTVDPNASPTASVTISCQWFPYIRGALKQLLLQSTWDTDDPDALNLVQGRVFSLIDLFQGCDGEFPSFACFEDLTANAFSWTLLDTGGNPSTAGLWALSSGWNAEPFTYDGGNITGCLVDIGLNLAAPTLISHCEFEWETVKGSDEFGGLNHSVKFYDGATLLETHTKLLTATVNGLNDWAFDVGDVICDFIVLNFWSANRYTGGSGDDGTLNLLNIEFEGGGTPPCSES